MEENKHMHSKKHSMQALFVITWC